MAFIANTVSQFLPNINVERMGRQAMRGAGLFSARALEVGAAGVDAYFSYIGPALEILKIGFYFTPMPELLKAGFGVDLTSEVSRLSKITGAIGSLILLGTFDYVAVPIIVDSARFAAREIRRHLPPPPPPLRRAEPVAEAGPDARLVALHREIESLRIQLAQARAAPETQAAAPPRRECVLMNTEVPFEFEIELHESVFDIRNFVRAMITFKEPLDP